MGQQSSGTATAVSESKLETLGQHIQVPRYEREQVGKGIVHIGAGGFNRSHLAVYLDDLLRSGGDLRWGECGIGLLPPDKRLHDALVSQDYLYGVLECGAEKQNLRIIGSLVEHLYAPEQTEQVLERMSSPGCAIVSMTVTEGGYFIEDGSKRFLDSDPRIRHDLEFPAKPSTFLGYICEAADRRRMRGLGPFTVLSCDNVQGNGDTARTALLAFAELRDPRLRQWIETNVSFPNSMVDRITPGTTDENRQFIREKFAVQDECPVIAEPFRQWVIEDRFSSGRPAWERVGAQFTTDVTAFERTKMRLLNGGHSSIAYLAALLGFKYVYEAMADRQIRGTLIRFLNEAGLVVHDLPGMAVAPYKNAIVERFANPFIPDQIMRIASEGSAKLLKFIVPTMEELCAMGESAQLLPLTVAAWLLAMCGKDESGHTIAIQDASASALSNFVASGGTDVKIALSAIPGFTRLMKEETGIVGQVQFYLNSLRSLGVRATLEAILAKDAVPIV